MRSRRTFMMVCVRLATRSEPSFFFATRYNAVLSVVRSSSGTGGAPRNVPFGTSKLSYARSASAIAPAESIEIRTGKAFGPRLKEPSHQRQIFLRQRDDDEQRADLL